jgi:hypothetical protein
LFVGLINQKKRIGLSGFLAQQTIDDALLAESSKAEKRAHRLNDSKNISLMEICHLKLLDYALYIQLLRFAQVSILQRTFSFYPRGQLYSQNWSSHVL